MKSLLALKTSTEECGISILPEYPSDMTRYLIYFYPGGTQGSGKGGIILKFLPRQGSPWIGVFAASSANPLCVFSSPGDRTVLVVADGTATMVSQDNPNAWETDPILYVAEVVVADEADIILLVGFNRICAWGVGGFRWVSKEISIDGITITDISRDALSGLAYDPCVASYHFKLNLADGSHEGGNG